MSGFPTIVMLGVWHWVAHIHGIFHEPLIHTYVGINTLNGSPQNDFHGIKCASLSPQNDVHNVTLMGLNPNCFVFPAASLRKKRPHLALGTFLTASPRCRPFKPWAAIGSRWKGLANHHEACEEWEIWEIYKSSLMGLWVIWCPMFWFLDIDVIRCPKMWWSFLWPTFEWWGGGLKFNYPWNVGFATEHGRLTKKNGRLTTKRVNPLINKPAHVKSTCSIYHDVSWYIMI